MEEDYSGWESLGLEEIILPDTAYKGVSGRMGTQMSGDGRMFTGSRLITGSRMVTGGRMVTGSRMTTGARPVTALRPAGFTASARPRQPAAPLTHIEDSAEQRIRQLEQQAVSLVEQSAGLRAQQPHQHHHQHQPTDINKSTALAQEAVSVERQLQQLQEQAGLSDTHNAELAFCVSFNLSCALWSQGLPAESLAALAASSGAPAHAPARQGLHAAKAHLARAEHRRALKLYRMALDGTPPAEKDLKLKIMHNIGLLLVGMGKYGEAASNFEHMMREGPGEQAGLHLVLCHVALGQLEEARGAFMSLLQSTSQDHDTLQESMMEESVFGDVVRADRLSAWCAARRSAAQRCVLRAARAITLHDQAGVSWCCTALRGSQRAELAGALEAAGALTALRGGRPKAARQALRRLSAQAQGSSRLRSLANTDLAFMAFAEGDTEEALRLCGEAGGGCGVWVCRGLCEARRGEGQGGWGAALQALQAATAADNNDRDAAYYSALACEKLGREEAALAELSRALRVAPADSCARARRAALQGSEDSYQQMLAELPTDVSVLCQLAELHHSRQDLHAARQLYNDADSVFPCSVSVLSWLGRSARQQGEPLQALPYYRRAMRLCPNQVEWGLAAAGCLRAAGRYREALEAYRRLHTHFPEDEDCLSQLVKLSSAAGLPEAERWSTQLQRTRQAKQLRGKMQSGTAYTRSDSLTPEDSSLVSISASPTLRGREKSSSGGVRSIASESSGSRAGRRHTNSNTDRQMLSRNVTRSTDRVEELPLPPE